MPEVIVIKKRKSKIPRALKEQVWIKHNKKKFQVKCPIQWCKIKLIVSTIMLAMFVPSRKVDLLAFPI